MDSYSEKTRTEQNEERKRLADERLQEARGRAKTRRELAWELLKASRNPAYVALRYGYPLCVMEEALKKIPPPEPAHVPGRANGARARQGKRPSDSTQDGREALETDGRERLVDSSDNDDGPTAPLCEE